MDRTIKELMELVQTNPGALTLRELQFVRHAQGKAESGHPDKQYERHKERARTRQRQLARAGQDIGPPHPPLDPARRKEGHQSLLRFCELYFKPRFPLPWSPDHLTILARMEQAIGYGGLFALAMPRGSGKTTICEVACIWAVMTGLHPFVMLIAVSNARALQLLKSIKLELLTNDLLDADWNEVCHPIRALDDRANRAKGQHIGGEKTFIAWRNAEIILPTVADKLAPWRERPGGANGCILGVAGITSGNIRGAKHTRADGTIVRPSLDIIDDPQDDQSARSKKQCDDREGLIAGAVLGQAGPGKSITAICPCTIIQPDDVAARLLDRDKSPLWTGQRYKLLYEFPERMDLWDEYGVMRADEFRNGGDGKLATAWYAPQKEEMDRGAVVAWPERFKPDERSALQHALNLFYADKRAFHAEYQNEPLEEQLGEGQLSNWWKSFVAERLTTAVGDKGSLTLPGQKGVDHRMLCDHLTAEYRTPTQGRGRKVDVWKIRPNRDDNHWLDCLVGCALGASMLGCSLLGNGAARAPRPRTTREEYERKRREFEARRGFR